jgi:hypothetical protein
MYNDSKGPGYHSMLRSRPGHSETMHWFCCKSNAATLVVNYDVDSCKCSNHGNYNCNTKKQP